MRNAELRRGRGLVRLWMAMKILYRKNKRGTGTDTGNSELRTPHSALIWW